MLQTLFLSWLICLKLSAHPIHIGLTYVNLNEKTGSLEIVHKIFIDDFDEALHDKYGQKLQLGTEWETSDSERFIQDYLKEKFILSLNGKAQKPTYIGKESDMEAVWVYQEIEHVTDIKELAITHSVLFEKFDDQKNIVHVEINQVKKSLLLSLDKEKETIEL